MKETEMGIIGKRVVMATRAEELPERMRDEFAAEIEVFRRANPHSVTRAEAVPRIEALRDEWN